MDAAPAPKSLPLILARELETLLEYAKARCSDGRERVCLAQEGMTITLDTANGILLSS